MPTNWRVYGKDTVACRLNRADLPGFFRKKVVVGPSEAAIVIRNGKAEEAITEKRAKATGVLDTVVRAFGGGADVDVIFVSLAPIDFSIYLGETTKQAVSASDASTSSSTRFSDRDSINLVEASQQVGWVVGSSTQSGSAAAETSRLDVSRINLQAVSLDREVIPAECLVRLVTDIEEVEQLAALMHGKVALATWDIAALIRDELLAKVLIPEIASHRADELRGNRQLLAQIEQQANLELQNTLASSGLTLESFTINWGLTEQELADIGRKREEREEEALKFAHGRRLAEMHRDTEVGRTRIANLQELRVAEAQGQQELKDLLLASEIQREMMVEGKRVDGAKIDAQVAEIQLGIEQREAQAKLQGERDAEMLRLDLEERAWRQKQAERAAQVDLEDKEMQSMVQMQIQMATAKHEREMSARRQEVDADFRRRQQEAEQAAAQRRMKLEESKTRMDMIRELVSKGLDTGAADASVLNTMLAQATEQEYATTSDAKVQARAEAQAARSNVDVYKEAEDRERLQQQQMTGLSTDMMQGAKQNIPGAAPVSPPGGAAAQPAMAAASGAGGADIKSRLLQLKELFDAGAIDESDYKARKAKILEEI